MWEGVGVGRRVRSDGGSGGECLQVLGDACLQCFPVTLQIVPVEGMCIE